MKKYSSWFFSFCLYISQPRNFLNLFLFFDPFQPRCSCKVCSYKKSVINLSAPCIECKFFMQFFLGGSKLISSFFWKNREAAFSFPPPGCSWPEYLLMSHCVHWHHPCYFHWISVLVCNFSLNYRSLFTEYTERKLLKIFMNLYWMSY